MLNGICAECRYAECHYAECRGAIFFYPEANLADCFLTALSTHFVQFPFFLSTGGTSKAIREPQIRETLQLLELMERYVPFGGIDDAIGNNNFGRRSMPDFNQGRSGVAPRH